MIPEQYGHLGEDSHPAEFCCPRAKNKYGFLPGRIGSGKKIQRFFKEEAQCETHSKNPSACC